MIRGKYLRERKGIRFKRRVKIVMTIFVLLLVHRIVFNSFSLYESNATTDANIEVAYFLLDDTYEEKTIMLEDMKPGDTKEVDNSISNYFAKAFLAVSTIAVNPFGSAIAISDNIFLLISTLANFKTFFLLCLVVYPPLTLAIISSSYINYPCNLDLILFISEGCTKVAFAKCFFCL